ncbi:HAMP domain-containing histidine kinase [Fulvivirga maritima]|uniref:sensor histidine kinase n=1 Tax=Fulvivirga maritima TaxID=2904247 RepID=UPI001F47D5B0|nr:HAMP domain-containing sensor histidine kinase [Fulvivirga maritima]UII27907.1 HAMP domain-containing histidine kinase [Fulvivirga maritima]
MNPTRFRLIGVIIVIIIILTSVLQLYYLYENYQQNKLRFENEVQQILDNSVEGYYAEIAKSDILTFTDINDINLELGRKSDSTVSKQKFSTRIGQSHLLSNQAMLWDHPDTVINDDSVHVSYIQITKNLSDSIMIDETNAIAMFKGQHMVDSLEKLQSLTSKIVISLTRDTLDFPMLNDLLNEELKRKNLNIDYALIHTNKDSVTNSYKTENDLPLALSTFSKSTYLPNKQKLEMKFENAPLVILKKGLWNILFSVLFVIIISATLIFLYRTIKSQKELSEIKNDLINNITHEFKTPIATVSTAIEGIRNFNKDNDPRKTEKYLQISHDQLIKLNLMVEKLLETATLDSEKLLLHSEPVDLGELLHQVAEKFTTFNPEKQISLTLKKQVTTDIDIFHFENAVSNLVDNAIKYGGNEIHITLAETEKTTILVKDNGGNIPKGQRNKVFEKFYRIPKGNVHNVKGFGIGLYYTRIIIEKHGGQITLIANDQNTTFKIEL